MIQVQKGLIDRKTGEWQSQIQTLSIGHDTYIVSFPFFILDPNIRKRGYKMVTVRARADI